MRRTVRLISLLLAAILLSGCSPRSSYKRQLKRELASGIRHDSLFMGIYLGMTDNDFYTHCWDLNRQGLVRQGSQNTTVEYQMKKELDHPATMDFYPEFRDGKIVEMPVRFIYNGWAPWNAGLSSDSLQEDVLRWCEEQYGKGFIAVQHPDRGTAFTRIDGNRRITIFRENDMYVWAIFRDMSVRDEAEEAAPGIAADSAGGENQE